jgi:hypothetical protein
MNILYETYTYPYMSFHGVRNALSFKNVVLATRVVRSINVYIQINYELSF